MVITASRVRSAKELSSVETAIRPANGYSDPPVCCSADAKRVQDRLGNIGRVRFTVIGMMGHAASDFIAQNARLKRAEVVETAVLPQLHPDQVKNLLNLQLLRAPQRLIARHQARLSVLARRSRWECSINVSDIASKWAPHPAHVTSVL